MKKVLVWGLSNRKAGTEGVISNYCRIVKNRNFDFLTLGEAPNYSYLSASQSNNRIISITPKSSSPIRYYSDLRNFMKDNHSDYDTLWFNTNHASNIDLLKLAYKYKIPRRIVHSHNSKHPSEPHLKALSNLNWNKCISLATERWACSAEAGEFLFKGEDYLIIPNLIDTKARCFSETKRAQLRHELDLFDKFVIGNVGRLCTQKNQEFLIRLLPLLLKKNKATRLVIVGKGELETELRVLAKDLSVQDYVLFAGEQSDIQGYLSTFDVFALPSLFEGLPLVLLEAQFNGLPCISSPKVSSSAMIADNCQRLDLNKPRAWADSLLSAKRDLTRLIEEKADKYDLYKNYDFANSLF